MRARSTIMFCVVTVIILAFAYFVTFGLSIGTSDIKPADNIKLGLDLTGGVYIVYQAKDTSVDDFQSKLDGTMKVFRTRLDAKNFTEATISQQGEDKIRVEIPINDTNKAQDPYEVAEYIGTPAKILVLDPDGNTIIEGKDFTSSKPMVDNNGNYIVSFTLSDDGKKKFGDATTDLVGQNLTITLDGTSISVAEVKEPITDGKGQIEGGFTKEECQNLALQIQSGALPLDLSENEVRSITATLGDTALQTSVMAGLIGLAILFIFMIIMYRTAGVAADLALIGYTALVVFVISLFEVQLTLPGIAGIILGIGMAVDANVIIFERFRDEYSAGKSTRAALKSGFHKAFSSIADANVTTIIAAIVLAIFGTGPIKGFAYTLAISIIVSMFSALFISNKLMKYLLGMFPNGTKMFLRIKKSKGGVEA